MPEISQPTWTLKSLLIRALPWTLLAAWIWKLTAVQNAAFTVIIAKGMHAIAGRPAPYLFCDERMLFWHPTMFPPIVGLAFASYWLRWPDRILRAAVGYLTHCSLTAVAITINESPYLQQTEWLNLVTAALVDANLLTFGVVIWVLAAGPWYHRPASPSPTDAKNSSPHRSPGSRLHRLFLIVRRGWVTRLALLWAGVAMIVPLFALTGSEEARAARARVGQALSEVSFFPHPSHQRNGIEREKQRRRDAQVLAALAQIRSAIEADEKDGLESAAMWHLTAHLVFSLRPEDPLRARDLLVRGTMAERKAKNTRAR